MSNEDGKSMGLALILPLLLYIVYLIREIRVSLGMSDDQKQDEDVRGCSG